jgi:hypothetical protein
VSPYLTSVQFEQDNDTHDTTTFGSTGHTFIAGLTNGKITIQGLWDKTATVGSRTVFQAKIGVATPTAFVYGPEGTTTGNVKYTGTAVVESYTESAPVADLVTVNIVLQISGAVTGGVY